MPKYISFWWQLLHIWEYPYVDQVSPLRRFCGDWWWWRSLSLVNRRSSTAVTPLLLKTPCHPKAATITPPLSPLALICQILLFQELLCFTSSRFLEIWFESHATQHWSLYIHSSITQQDSGRTQGKITGIFGIFFENAGLWWFWRCYKTSWRNAP